MFTRTASDSTIIVIIMALTLSVGAIVGMVPIGQPAPQCEMTRAKTIIRRDARRDSARFAGEMRIAARTGDTAKVNAVVRAQVAQAERDDQAGMMRLLAASIADSALACRDNH